MRAIWHIALKDIRLILCDKAAAFFAFGWPVMVALLFGTIFSVGGPGEWKMRVAVVDEDGTAQSREFIRELDEREELEVVETERQQATEKVRRGELGAYIVLPPGFGRAREQSFWGGPARVELGIDPSRKATAGLLKSVVMRQMFSSYERYFTDPDYVRAEMGKARREVEAGDDVPEPMRSTLLQFLRSAEKMADHMPQPGEGGSREWVPFDFEQTDVARRQEQRPRSSYELTMPQGAAWGFICCAAVFGISLVIERSKGTLRRLQAAPLGRAHILAGKALACFASMCAVAAVIFAFGRFAFGVRPGSYAMLALAVGSTAVCFVGIMMVVSVLGRTEASANAFAWPIFMIMALAGGGMVPLMAMPGWLRAISTFSPLKWGMLALEGAIWREFSLAEMLKPCGILLAVAIVCFALGVRLFPWTHEG
ncbi:MAG: ABC transporter permease [Candidatus Brocadiia bacterium]